MDKDAVAVGMDPLEFRMRNAYRDGDMKAHRREAKNCALIECAQVAAEKANWPLREEFRRMSSRVGRAAGRSDAPRPMTPAVQTGTGPLRRAYDRPAASGPAQVEPPPAPVRAAPPPPAPRPPGSTHGAPRFSSVFGTRRR
jgi:Molybdopterin-binding domain of aldehyde dehydrogenase